MRERCFEIIDTLIQKRHDMGLTQRDVASLSGLSQPVIARFESKKNIPNLDTLLKVATVLDCEMSVVDKR